MQPTIRSANMTFMLQRKITYPITQQLKIMTELEENIPKSYRPQDNFKLAQITIFTQKQSYEGQLTGKSIAKQLSWNSQSFNTLIQCLMGKREKLQMKFFPVQNTDFKTQRNTVLSKDQMKNFERLVHHFEIVCQISSGINLTLFTVQMQPSNQSNPFINMMKKFSQIQQTFRQKQKSYKQKEESLKSQLNQIEAVQKQIIDSSSIEINLMKKQFIKHVNNEKAKIRKLMGSVPMINPLNGLIENRIIPSKQNMQKIPQKQVESDQESKNEELKNRVIKKVDRQFYDKRQNQKMEVQSEVYSKFSSQSSNNNEKVKNQCKKEQEVYKKNGRKFTLDQSSSDDEIDHNGDENKQKKQKTFLQQQREKMQNLQGGQNQWDALFN